MCSSRSSLQLRFVLSPHFPDTQLTWSPNRGDGQVIAPFLITLRVANRSALMSDTDTYENTGPLRFGGQEKSVGSNGSPLASSTDTYKGTHSTMVGTIPDSEALDGTSWVFPT